MKAQEVPLLTLLAGSQQFVIPVFQRDYSWTEAQCAQFLEDIFRAAEAPEGVIHFMGSIVYVGHQGMDAVLPRWMVIDGQQRLTSCMLLLIALRERLAQAGDNVPPQDSPRAIDEQYLRNPYAPNSVLRAKLALRGLDNEWLGHLLLGQAQPANTASRVPENLDFFKEAIEGHDPREILKGVRRVVVVSVSLTAGQDNPQLIFESLNSTGLSLTQADLVRNYVLMGHAEPRQTEWYESYWRPLEAAFGNRYREFFDNFLRDFLSVEFRLVKLLKLDAVYREFRQWYPSHLNQPNHSAEGAAKLQRLLRYGKFYCRYLFGPAGSPALEEAVARLRELVDVAAPLVTALLECFEEEKTLSEAELIEALDVIESYVFRRSVVGAETRGGGAIFAMLAYKLNRAKPLANLKAQLARMGRGKEFPSDAEFVHALTTRDMYHRRSAFYFFARLTNSGKEKVQLTDEISIEHVLPQTENLAAEWRTMLGEDWKEVQATWLHRLGNLTLTGFNSELRARPFLEKKQFKDGGYANSPIWLNKSVAKYDSWSEEPIRERGDFLAQEALKVWKPLAADPVAVAEAALQEALEGAAGMSVEAIPCTAAARPWFDALAEYSRTLNAEVREIPHSKSVEYRTPEWFVELLPRTKSVLVRLAVEPEDVADISDKVTSASEWQWISYSEVSGGSLFEMRHDAEIEVARRLVKRAHELAMSGE